MLTPSHVPHLDTRYLGVLGDVHGNVEWTRFALKTLSLSGISSIVQLGDFGLMGDIFRWLAKINKTLLENDQWLFVVPGNHENYDYINDDSKFDIDEFGIRWTKTGVAHLESRIGLLPRGFTWQHRKRLFMGLGGASSIDFLHRTRNKTWWEGENITDGEVDSIIAELDGVHVDAMFTHDAPRDVITLAEYAASTSLNWDIKELAYAETSRARLDKVFHFAQPGLLMHGHWHLYLDETGEFENHWADSDGWSEESSVSFESRIVGLNMDNSPHNIAVLDVDKLDVSILDREVAIGTKHIIGERRVFEG